MNWGLGCHSTARTGIKQSLTQAYQVWCPHVAQAPRLYAKQAQATSLAAPSSAPGGSPIGHTLLPDHADDSDSHSCAGAMHERPSIISLAESPQADAGGPSDASVDRTAANLQHLGTRAPTHRDLGLTTACGGEAGTSAVPQFSGSCRGRVLPHHSQHIVPGNAPSISALAHTRPPADRTAEASTSRPSGAGLDRCSSSCSSRTSRWSSAVGSKTAASNSSSRHPRPASARHRPRGPPIRAAQGIAAPGGCATASGGEAGGGDDSAPDSSAAASRSGLSSEAPNSTAVGAGADAAPAATGAAATSSADGGRQAAAGGRHPGGTATEASRQPLTLERLREQNDGLRTIAIGVLRNRLVALGGLLQMDHTAALQLCRVVPGLLGAESRDLVRAWHRLCDSLGGDEPARGAAAAAPLLLVLPPDRVPACISSLAAATALPRAAAAALVAEWPQLATHAPASLEAKLEGLRRLLGPAPPTGPKAPAAAGPPGPLPQAQPAALRAALRAAPRLLTFSTSALCRHHTELSALLGSPERLRAALAREPGLLLQRPAAVAAKLALLRHLMDCDQQPSAVAALVVRAPGLLRRSLAALAAGCRALSIWQFRRRDKLRMCLSRPGLLALPPAELHGRCRWLRRLMLSNAYYHSALRRLPPSLVAVLVAALPQAWARLQYLAESSQECRMCVMDVVECRQEDFEARFPEFGRWLQFKIKLMGAENPWRGTLRIRGFYTVRDKPTHGTPNQMNLLQRQQRQGVSRRPHHHHHRQHQHASGPSVPVVLVEAGEVRSGGSTVARPRRVLRQPMTHQPHPALPLAPPPLAAAPPPPVGALSGAPALLILPSVGVEMTPQPLTPQPSPAGAGARKRLPAAGREAAAVSAAAAAAEPPR